MSEANIGTVKVILGENTEALTRHNKSYVKIGDQVKEGVALIMEGFAKIIASSNELNALTPNIATAFRAIDNALEGTGTLQEPRDRLLAYLGNVTDQARIVANLADIGEDMQQHAVHAAVSAMEQDAQAAIMPIQQISIRGMIM